MTMSLLVRSSAMILLICTGPPAPTAPGAPTAGCPTPGAGVPGCASEMPKERVPGLPPACEVKISCSFCCKVCALAYCTCTMWISSEPPG